MPLIKYACCNCGYWQPWFADQSPLTCPVCTDVRNALPDDGWDFRSFEQVQSAVQTSWGTVCPGILGFHCSPPFGLNGAGWLILREEGNIAFEAAPVYTEEALAEIDRLGGIAILGASHPHGFGALWQLQERFQPTVILHRDALQFTKAFRVTWPADDYHRFAPGVSLRHLGGHYEGQSLLYDENLGAVFCGDALKVEYSDGKPTALSCHKGFHYDIPLSHDELRHYQRVFSQLDFYRVLTPFDYAEGITQTHCLGLFEQLLRGAPHTKPISLSELS